MSGSPRHVGLLIGLLAALVVGLLAVVVVGAVWLKPWERPAEGRHEEAVGQGEMEGGKGGAKGQAETLTTLEQEGRSAESTEGGGTATLNVNGGNALAQGATVKVFDQAGTVVGTGSVPTTLALGADGQYKVVVTKPGCHDWEGWQAIGAAGSGANLSVSLQERADKVNVALCTATGRRATQWCPATVRRDRGSSEVPTWCTLHKAGAVEVAVDLCAASGRRANRYCPRVVARRVLSNQVPGYCTVHGAPARTVTVSLCTASGRRANRYCPNTVSRAVRETEVPGYCSVHGAPETVRLTVCSQSGLRATPYCPSTKVIAFPANSDLESCDRHTKPKPPAMVSWDVCAESGDKAGRWCPTTTARSLPRGERPSPCQVHTGPGESAQSQRTCPECGTINRGSAIRCSNCRQRF